MAIFVVLLTVCTSAATGAPLHIPACQRPPRIDGELSDPCWASAAVVEDMAIFRDSDGRRTNDTSALLCRDRAWLYFAFRCHNPLMGHVVQTIFDHDGPVQRDDSIEIFLAPGTAGKLHYHFMLSFANVRNERRIGADFGRDIGWSTPWRSVTRRTKDGWVAEVAIPLFALAGGDLAKATMNLVRSKVEVALDPYGAKMDEKVVFSSWSRLERSAHEPQRFSPVSGLGGFAPEVPFAPLLEDATVEGYRMAGGDTTYTVRLKLVRGTPVSGTVRACALESTEGNDPREVAQDVALHESAQSVTLAVPTDTFRPRNVAVALRDPETGSLYIQSTISDVSALEVMATPVTDRDYYTTEEVVRLRLSPGHPCSPPPRLDPRHLRLRLWPRRSQQVDRARCRSARQGEPSLRQGLVARHPLRPRHDLPPAVPRRCPAPVRRHRRPSDRALRHAHEIGFDSEREP